ncbi:poly(U)-specific 3'-to-5' RNA exonuclease [Coemansia sp. RSA 1200]|nr:poly(U)-specific 3'-to-5' RNA exonuclease [Coemansia sp. RSA 1200]
MRQSTITPLVDYPSSDSSSRSSSRNGSSSGRIAGLGDDLAEQPLDMGHVPGGWAGHVYLAVKESVGLCRVSQTCIQEICRRRQQQQQQRGAGDAGTRKAETAERPSQDAAGASKEEREGGEETAGGLNQEDRVRRVDNLHVSLTRVFYLQEHEICGFVEALEKAVRAASRGPFAIGFSKASVYASETGRRAFVGLDIGHGAERLAGMARVVDEVMRRFGKQPFFANARFHVSIVRVDEGGRMIGRQQQEKELGDAMQEEILALPAVQIAQLECSFGNRFYSIAL